MTGLTKYIRQGKTTLYIEGYGPGRDHTRIGIRRKGGLSRMIDMNIERLVALKGYIDSRLDELDPYHKRAT